MPGLWVLATLIAAAAQTARNATQASLTRTIGTVGATQVRFLFGLPFAVLFLVILLAVTGEPLPAITARSFGFTVLGALSQIAATAFMLRLMQARSFGVTTAWIKTEPVTVALVASAVLGDPLTLPALVAIAFATSGVVLMSHKPGAEKTVTAHPGTGAAPWHDLRAALTGMLAGLLFGLSAIGFRGGILGLGTGDFVLHATTILVLALVIQSAVLMVWLGICNRSALRASLMVWRASLGAGFLGAFASQFWFIGFALTTAANVRTLALVEVILAQVVARLAFGQRASARQLLGMAIIMLGVGLLLRTQA